MMDITITETLDNPKDTDNFLHNKEKAKHLLTKIKNKTIKTSAKTK